jgi:hypothetical protein
MVASHFKTDRAPMTDSGVKYLFDVSYYNLETFVILMLFSLHLYAFSRIATSLLADPIFSPQSCSQTLETSNITILGRGQAIFDRSLFHENCALFAFSAVSNVADGIYCTELCERANGSHRNSNVLELFPRVHRH